MAEEGHPFELGLVMAGAVSAGAYTAGVVDVLLQALDSWERARGTAPDERGPVPPHRVRLRVLTGASAGGMTAAMTARAVGEPLRPAPLDPRETSDNRLYRAWVRDVDARHLLRTDDLADPRATVRSALDSSVLDRICATALARDGSTRVERAWVSDPLDVLLTVANLQGVPYRIGFTGATRRGHGIVLHADYTRFVRSRSKLDGAGWGLDPDAADGDEGWVRLGEAALATGAFPGGLLPRPLRRPRGDYLARRWRVPGQGDPGEPCYQEESIPPAWPPDCADLPDYPFLAVDGGLIDNEPLELARRALAQGERCNPRSPERAHRAVVMVDPFTSFEWDGAVPEPAAYDVLDVLGLMFGTLIDQVRFKPDELSLARSEHVYSRYLVTPTRALGDGQAPHPIASGMLGGFGGFLSARFRNHDFHLGRRNGQRFLQKHFALPLEAARANPVFAGTPEETFRRFAFEDEGGVYYPLVPLVGETRAALPRIPWASLAMPDEEVTVLEEMLARRLERVVTRLGSRRLAKPLPRWALNAAVRWNRRKWAAALMDIARKELETYGLGERSSRGTARPAPLPAPAGAA